MWEILFSFRIKLVALTSFSKRKDIKTVGNKPGTIFGLCKEHKQQVDGCLPFRPILLTLKTPTYKLAKLLVSILNLFITIECKVGDSLHFVEDIYEQEPELSLF